MLSSISVVVPCHNSERYLAQTLGCLLEQTRVPDEIVVVDDGSTDRSGEIAEQFHASRPDTIRLLRSSKRHAAAARNLGMLNSQSAGIMFLDADDVLSPDTISSLGEALCDGRDEIALCPWYRLVASDSSWNAQPPSCQRRLLRDDALSGWLTGWYYPPCAVMWTRESLEFAGFWDELRRVNQDGDLMMRALIEDCSLRFVKDGAGFYRRLSSGEVSLSNTRRERESLNSRLQGLRKIAYWLEERGRLDIYRPAITRGFELLSEDADGAGEIQKQCKLFIGRFGLSGRERIEDRRHRREPRNYQSQVLEHFDEGLIGKEITFGLTSDSETLQQFSGIEGCDREAIDRNASPLTSVQQTKTREARPAVSVIIPVFNRAGSISRAIASVLKQSFYDFELLVIDDGSTDSTCEVVKGFVDERVRLVRQGINSGVSAARNRGMRESRADLIAFLDSDDEWFDKKLECQVGLFKTASCLLGLVYGGVENEYNDGLRENWYPTERGNIYQKMLQKNAIHGSSGVMISRRVIASAGYFDEAIPAIEDYEYWLRICRHFLVDYIEQPLIRYHDTDTPERKSLNLSQNYDARCYFYQKHFAELSDARVAHLFLLETARRHLKSGTQRLEPARKMALEAIALRPQSALAYRTLIKTTPIEEIIQRVRWRFA